MVRRIAIALLVVVGSLAPASARAESAPEKKAPKRVTFTVVSRNGGLIKVAALKWVPTRAKTVLLAVHGSGGVKENNWGPLAVRGYSFAHRRYNEGRATVAIDLPAYGESEGDAPYPFFDKDLVGIEDYAFVVDQIGRALRAEFRKVVGVGHSMGGLIVDVTQGIFGTFDAIIPAAWSHGGWSQRAKGNCDPYNPEGYCDDVRVILFSRKHADPDVIEAFVAQLDMFTFLQTIDIGGWGAYWTRPMLGPGPDDVTATIDVPVLILLAELDWFWDKEHMLQEKTHFPGSDDVTQVVLKNTGHALFHHNNHDAVQELVGAWLDAREF